MGALASWLWMMALRRRDEKGSLALLGVSAGTIAVFVTHVVRGHGASVREVGALHRSISPGDSKQAVHDQLARPGFGSLRLDEVSEHEWRVGVFSWPSNWMLVLELDDAASVTAVRVRGVDGPEFVPAGAPADRTR